MKNSITIYMADLVHDYFPGNYVVPLNVASIAAYLTQVLGENIRVKLFKSPSALLMAIKEDVPDILSLSNYLWNQHLSFQIGTHLKQEFPELVITMGGPGTRTEETGIRQFLRQNKYVDIYMLHEGEQPFLNFIKKILNKMPPDALHLKKLFADGQVIQGCAYLMEQEVVYSESDLLSDLSGLPSPYLTGWLDTFLDKGFVPLFESNRGCPFSCCYCTWGCKVLRKIREFPLERVFAEMNYVAEKYPNLPYWMFADANFGLLNRDVEIAKRIRDIKERTPELGKVHLWYSKNKLENNKKISDLVGGRHLIAVQTLDPKVQKAIHRPNISLEKIKGAAVEIKKRGYGYTSTDVIAGLPLETAESQMNTLRTCFDIDFDYIQPFNAILLPGSELDQDDLREKYAIKTKYRLRQGAYGIYQGIKAVECEEIVVATSTMAEEDLLKFRIIHWLIWFGWNTNFLKPVFRYLKTYYNVNPLDIIRNIVDHDKEKYQYVNRLFQEFHNDSRMERFDSSSALRERYLQKEQFDKLLQDGFSKLNYKFTTYFIFNKLLYQEFCDLIQEVASELTHHELPSSIFTYIRELVVDVEELFNSEHLEEKDIITEREVAEFILSKKLETTSSYVHIQLYKKPQDIHFLREVLKKFEYSKNKQLAIEKSLEVSAVGFSYKPKMKKEVVV